MYYLVEIAVTSSGTAKAINGPMDYNAAIMQMFQVIASAIANTSVSSCCCIVLDEHGNTVRNEFWERS